MAETSAFAGCPPVAAAHPQAEARPVAPLATVLVSAWRGQETALAGAVRAACGLDLPPAGRWTEAGGLTAIWTAPGQWWLQRPGRHDLMGELATLAAHAALIDQSDARATLRLCGPGARRILMSLLPLDLHPAAFAPGQAASTLAAHLTVALRQVDDAPSYDLSCLRSYAGSLWRALELAGAGRLTLTHG